MLNAKLIVVGGDSTETEFELNLPAIVGRGVEADIPVNDGLISRRHAELFESAGKLFVKDLGSRNGTFVNNRKIVEASPVEPNQLLTLGTITFRAVYQLTASARNECSMGLKDTVRITFDQTESLLDPPHLRSKVSGVVSTLVSDSTTIDIDEYEAACAEAACAKAACAEATCAEAGNLPGPIVSASPMDSLRTGHPK